MYHINVKKNIKQIKVMVPIAIISILLFVSIYVFQGTVSDTLQNEVEDKLLEVTLQTNLLLAERLKYNFAELSAIADYFSTQTIENQNLAIDLIQSTKKNSKYHFIGVISVDGTEIYNNVIPKNQLDMLQRSFRGYNQALYVPASTLSEDGCILISVPIKKGGNIAGAVYGVLQGSQMRHLFAGNVFKGQGFTFSLYKDFKTVILPEDKENSQRYSLINGLFLNKENSAAFIGLEKKLYYFSFGVQKFNYNNKEYYVACVPFHQMEGWYIASVIPANNINQMTKKVLFLATVSFLCLAILFLISFWVIGANDRKKQQEIFRLAYIDKLTGIDNWEKLKKDCSEMATHENMALVLLDIDEFRLLNDIMKEAYADNLLVHMAKVIARDVKVNERVCRLKDDKFILYLENSEQLKMRIKTMMDDIVNYSGSYFITISCGVSLTDKETVINNAVLDNCLLACRVAKNLKNNTLDKIIYFDNKLKDLQIEARILQNDLSRALGDGDFLVYMQPKVNLKDGKWSGCEVLIRWQHPVYGFLFPGRFISIFEEAGLIGSIDMYMFEQACVLIRKWLDEGISVLPISVNLSRNQMSNVNLAEELAAIVNKYNIPFELLEVELTESTFFADATQLIDTMNSIRAKGFKISIDDFGSGYSSLSTLLQIPVDTIKLDKSFVDAWEEHKNIIVIKGIVTMAHYMGLKIVCEGVETAEQLAMLQELGCDMVQGYYYSKPIGVAAYEKLVYGKDRAGEAR